MLDEINHTKTKELESEIQRLRSIISYDACDMSIGELAFLYTSGDLCTKKEHCNYLNASYKERSVAISLLLLGYPQASLTFELNRENGKFEFNGYSLILLLGTIFSFMGLCDLDGEPTKTFILEGCCAIPKLNGFVLDEKASKKHNNAPFLSAELRMLFKRSKFLIRIIKYS